MVFPFDCQNGVIFDIFWVQVFLPELVPDSDKFWGKPHGSPNAPIILVSKAVMEQILCTIQNYTCTCKTKKLSEVQGNQN